MARKLLLFKQQALARGDLFSPSLEVVRKTLLRFYSDYYHFRGNQFQIIDRMNSIVADFNLPVPCELLNLLEEAEDASNPQSGFEDWHRDHVLHSLNLFSFGALLITSFPCVRDLFGTLPIEKKLKKWAFCALLHDVGYIETGNIVLRTELLERFSSSARKVMFQLFCAYGHKSILTQNVDHEKRERIPELRVLTSESRRLVDRKLGMWGPSPSLPNRSPDPRYSYFAKANTDHGVSSAVILSICREIAETISRDPERIHELAIDPPDSNLWDGLDDSIYAIALHDKAQEKIDAIRDGLSVINPWISFLHLMDELTEYDRPALKNGSTRVVTPIEEIDIEVVDDRPIIYFPVIERWREKLPKLNNIASMFDIGIKEKSSNA